MQLPITEPVLKVRTNENGGGGEGSYSVVVSFPIEVIDALLYFNIYFFLFAAQCTVRAIIVDTAAPLFYKTLFDHMLASILMVQLCQLH